MVENASWPWPYARVNISPAEFEKQVRDWLTEAARRECLTCSVTHQGVVQGLGGAYSIDVLVDLVVLGGAHITVLAECKHQSRPVERDEILALEAKLRDVGAHKGMVFSTSGFQSGAVEFAGSRGIATVTIVAGASMYQTRVWGPPTAPPPWVHIDPLVGLRETCEGATLRAHSIWTGYSDALVEWLRQVWPEALTR